MAGFPSIFAFTLGGEPEPSERMTRAALQLLPRGRAWQRRADSNQGKLLGGLVEEFAQVDGKARRLVGDDLVPDRVNGVLTDWLRALAITPPASATDEERLALVQGKLVFSADNSRPALLRLAASLGYTVSTINAYAPAEAGALEAGGHAWGQGWAWVKEIVFVTGAANSVFMKTLLEWLPADGWLVFRLSGDPEFTWQTPPANEANDVIRRGDVVTVAIVPPP